MLHVTVSVRGGAGNSFSSDDSDCSGLFKNQFLINILSFRSEVRNIVK